ncbi:MAG: DMT family transporter [Nannocystaceae bacterium]|nr:DMT family transporter [Nannocystaceae bacterium]
MPLGELAALGTALCWAFTAVCFAAAGARIGSLSVNLIRLVIALAMLTAFEAVVRGTALPLDASAHAWTWLSISGIVGFCIGDLCLFRALVVIGPRLSSLLMSLAPLLTAVFGWLLLGETLSATEALGMTLTIAGLGWAVLDRTPPAANHQGARAPKGRALAVGVALGIGGAAGQAGGLVLSKYGMGQYDPFAATQIRVIAGIAGFSLLFVVTGWWPRTIRALREGRAMLYTSAGAFFGPFVGVSLSLLAVQRTSTGVAAALMATSPILVIPIVMFVRRERVGLGGVLGAIVTVAGVILLVAG